jgi:hypothetical protein
MNNGETEKSVSPSPYYMPTESFQGVDNCGASLATFSPAAVCTGTNGNPKTVQTNLCTVFLKDTTCSALTGLDTLAPGMSAQRARQPPFVREAATSLSGLSLRMPACTPKGGCRALDLLPKHERQCLDKSAPTFRVLILLWFFPCSFGERGQAGMSNPTGTLRR